MTTPIEPKKSGISPAVIILCALLAAGGAGAWHYMQQGQLPDALSGFFSSSKRPSTPASSQNSGPASGSSSSSGYAGNSYGSGNDPLRSGNSVSGSIPSTGIPTVPDSATKGLSGTTTPGATAGPDDLSASAITTPGATQPNATTGAATPGATTPGDAQHGAQNSTGGPDSQNTTAEQIPSGQGADTPGTNAQTPGSQSSSQAGADSGQKPQGTENAGEGEKKGAQSANPSSAANASGGSGKAFDGQRNSSSAGDAASTVVLYGKAKPVGGKRHIVRGNVPEGQEDAPVRIAPGSQDGLVKNSFVEDFAHFLAENYWPAGTHSTAKGRPSSTAGVKWANTRYGAHLKGFAVDAGQPDTARHQVLDYVFMPSMIDGLYALYNGRFFDALENEALARRVGSKHVPLTAGQAAGMFEVYGGMASTLGKAVKNYTRSPEVRSAVAAYAKADAQAEEAARKYAAASSSRKVQAAAGYRAAVDKRERMKNRVLSVMRQKDSFGALDADSLVYVAQWLSRRGEDKMAAAKALAGVLENASARLKDLEHYYRTNPLARERMEALAGE